MWLCYWEVDIEFQQLNPSHDRVISWLAKAICIRFDDIRVLLQFCKFCVYECVVVG